ncbi:Pol Polyprotein [Phytophthora cinnamomi]|uniref:Pol Polyprotein n=1 Tax=Phytophthora cinnamomi TaxID=4785 RepID=UPI00355A71DD|nr:Pol Polyprotein [Phytophthora cinnamomi]
MNNKLEGPALAFFDKMLPKWVAESNTVEHVMDRMLGFYSTKVPVSKAMDLMSETKPSNKTWTEHFQYLVPMLAVACHAVAAVVLVVEVATVAKVAEDKDSSDVLMPAEIARAGAVARKAT